jgi:hypothetical protein
MNKQLIEAFKIAAIEKAKKDGEIYYTSDIEGFKKGFDAAIKLFDKPNGIEKMKERLYASASGINERILSTISVKSVADCGDTSFKCDYRVKDGCHKIGECSVKM